MSITYDTKFSNSPAVLLSAQRALHDKLERIAHNLSKVDVNGAKEESIVFAEQVSKSKDGKMVSYVKEEGILRNLEQGVLKSTGNPLDLALEGDAYFTLQDPKNNAVRYTRDGHFHVNRDNFLVNDQNLQVLSTTRTNISIPFEEQPIRITHTGKVIGAKGVIADLNIVAFEKEQALISKTGGLYETDQKEVEPKRFQIEQGYLEDSNINAIKQATLIVDVSRAYQQIQAVIEKTNDNLQETIERVVKIV